MKKTEKKRKQSARKSSYAELKARLDAMSNQLVDAKIAVHSAKSAAAHEANQAQALRVHLRSLEHANGTLLAALGCALNIAPFIPAQQDGCSQSPSA